MRLYRCRLDMRACHPASKTGDRLATVEVSTPHSPSQGSRALLGSAAWVGKSANISVASRTRLDITFEQSGSDPEGGAASGRRPAPGDLPGFSSWERHDAGFRHEDGPLTKLSDMQHDLLATAAARDDGSLLPADPHLGTRQDRIARSISSLLGKSLAVEQATEDPLRCWREQDGILYGATITDAGRLAIGDEVQPAPEPAPGPVASGVSKIAQVQALLEREPGATLAELVVATGWQPHTTRAMLTGLRKKGHAIERRKRDDVSCYHLPVVDA
jgi:hypothetical protein